MSVVEDIEHLDFDVPELATGREKKQDKPDRDYVAHGNGVIAVAWGGGRTANGQPRGSYVEAGPIEDSIPAPYVSERPLTGNKEVDRYRSYQPNWMGAVTFRNNEQAWLEDFEAEHPHITLGAE